MCVYAYASVCVGVYVCLSEHVCVCVYVCLSVCVRVYFKSFLEQHLSNISFWD